MSRREDRCPPVPLRILYDLPNGSFKLFCLAAAEGKSMNPRSNFDSLLRGERPIGVRVAKIQRDRVLGTLGLDLPRWRQAVREWEAAGLVHRCKPGQLFLFLSPAETCPDCQPVTESYAGTSLTVTSDVTASYEDKHERGNPLREQEEGRVAGWGSDRAGPSASESIKKPSIKPPKNRAASEKAMRDAFGRGDFAEIEHLADNLGWSVIVHHAKRAPEDAESRDALDRKLPHAS